MWGWARGSGSCKSAGHQEKIRYICSKYAPSSFQSATAVISLTRERPEVIFKSRLERALIDSNLRLAEPPTQGLYCQPEATRTSRVLSKVDYEELWGDLLDRISTDLFQMATVTCGPAPRDDVTAFAVAWEQSPLPSTGGRACQCQPFSLWRCNAVVPSMTGER